MTVTQAKNSFLGKTLGLSEAESPDRGGAPLGGSRYQQHTVYHPLDDRNNLIGTCTAVYAT
jgi:hypothetical protein